MSDESERMIRQHEKLEPHESDISSRENAAALLWAIGDDENQAAAETIWRNLKTSPKTIEVLKNYVLRLKKEQLKHS